MDISNCNLGLENLQRKNFFSTHQFCSILMHNVVYYIITYLICFKTNFKLWKRRKIKSHLAKVSIFLNKNFIFFNNQIRNFTISWLPSKVFSTNLHLQQKIFRFVVFFKNRISSISQILKHKNDIDETKWFT